MEPPTEELKHLIFPDALGAASAYKLHFEDPTKSARPSPLLVEVGTPSPQPGPDAPLRTSNVVTIGIIGVTYPASRDFLQKLHARLPTARLLLHSFDFDSTHKAAVLTRKSWAESGQFLRNSADVLIEHGVDVLCLPANTSHHSAALEVLLEGLPVPFLSMPEAVARLAARRKTKIVSVFGTRMTMTEERLYPEAFERAFEKTEAGETAGEDFPGVKVHLPASAAVVDAVHNIIFDRLLKNDFREEDARRVEALVLDVAEEVKTREKGVELGAVVLACTELPMLFEAVHGVGEGGEVKIPAVFIDSSAALVDAVCAWTHQAPLH